MSRRLLIDESPLLVIPGLARIVGLNEAIVLQQVHYWLNPKFNKTVIQNRHWVWKTYKQWGEEFEFWGDKTIRRTIEQLEEKGLLVTFKKVIQFKTVKYYTIDYKHLETLLCKGEATPEEEFSYQEPSCVEGPIHAEMSSGELRSSSEGEQAVKGSSPEEGASLLTSLTQSPPSSLFESSKPPRPPGIVWTGQNDQTGLPVWAPRGGHYDQLGVVNMTIPYNKEKETTVTKITPPPQTPPPKNLEEEEEEEFDLDEFVKVWNKLIQRERPLRGLSESRQSALQSVLEDLFERSLKKWTAYCQAIAGNKFLMGGGPKGWRASFDWAVKPENALKVLEGAYWEDASLEISPKLSEAEEQKNLEGHIRDEGWLEISRELVHRIGFPVYKSWFWNLPSPRLEGSTLILNAPTRFKRDYLQTHYAADLQEAVRLTHPEIQEVKIIHGKEGLS